ncbi:MAG: proprotein convertase P-domain-containing protein, partial [Acidobacteria bacterium]|nr:proprotein convertase P-domain-containing protein [Acidobacteriota bacterium]
ILTGTYAPTDVSPGDVLTAPAPAGPYSTSLAAFNGTNPNGTWSLYVFDDAGSDIGALFGFTLLISPQFNNTTAVPIPPGAPGVTSGTTESSLQISGLTAPITKVTVSLHITHTFNGDLDISLIGPDNTIVELSSDNGGSNNNYGNSCGDRTNFDDAAATAITAGVTPFAGTFRPEAALSAFNGKSGVAANGTWRLRVVDDTGGDIGSLVCWSVAISQNENTTAQPPTALLASSIVGNQVTLRWTPPGAGLAPTSYVVEGGVNPGETLASLPTANASPILTFNAPTGAFYVRLRTLSGASLSGVSHEIRIFVNLSVAPSAPTLLQRVISGATLGLSWRNTFGGSGPTSLMLDVTGSATTSIPLGLSESASFSSVPAGTYNLSLRAVNAGGISTSSNIVTVTLPSAMCSSAPGTPNRFLAYKIGNTIYVVWEPSPLGGAPTGFVLNVTGSFVGSFPTTGRTLSGAVGPGAYGLSVAATNACGISTATAVQVVNIP